jgi:hypothetical protein
MAAGYGPTAFPFMPRKFGFLRGSQDCTKLIGGTLTCNAPII